MYNLWSHRIGGLLMAAIWLFPHPLYALDNLQSLNIFSKKYDLVRKPKAGEMEYFQIVRTDIMLSKTGEVTGRSTSSGQFKREVVYVREDGHWMDRYTWKNFYSGRSESPTDSLIETEVTAVKGFTYDLASTDMHSVPPIQIGGLAKTSDTFAFFVIAWDVVTISQAAMPRPSYALQDLKQVGDQVQEKEDRIHAPFDFTPVLSNFSFKRQGLTATLSGLTDVEKTACAMIQFESNNNPIEYDFTTETTNIHLSGTEWSSGKTLVSLNDQTIMHGELNATLVGLQTAIKPGQWLQYPIVVKQRVLLKRISKEEFEKN